METITVTDHEIAEILLVSKRTIQRLSSDYGMPKIGRNKYDLAACTTWYIQHLLQKKDGTDDTMEAERRLLIRAQRHRHELENAKRRGELIDAETVGIVLNELGVIFATQLEGFGPRLAQQLAVLQDPGDVTRLLTNESRAIRQAAAARVSDFAASYGGLGDSDPAPRRKPRRVGRSRKNTAAGKPGAGAVAN